MSAANNKKPNVGLWFAATFLMFFCRAFIYSTWVTRGPEVKKLLHFNNFQLGVMTMLYPIGGLIAVQFAGRLVHKFGSRKVAGAIYTIAAIALTVTGISIVHGNPFFAALGLAITGSEMAIADFVGNYEGNLADKASKRSIFSAIHSAYGLGMMAAAAMAGAFSNHNVSVQINYFIVSATAFAGGIFAALAIPHHHETEVSETDKKLLKQQIKETWRDRRSQLIAIVGLSFIMAEMSAAIWVPIALTNSGFTPGRAAFALSFFWVIVTLFRAIGGSIVDAIGRYRTVKYSALLTAIGIALFMANNAISIPFVALLIWGAGMAIGFPMCVSAMGDEPKLSAARINMIMTTIYITSITVGPALGSIGQLFGIYVAFGIPLVISLIAFRLSGATKPKNS